jgi:hypothetical protein
MARNEMGTLPKHAPLPPRRARDNQMVRRERERMNLHKTGGRARLSGAAVYHDCARRRINSKVKNTPQN